MYKHKGSLLLLSWKLKVCFILRMLWIFWDLRCLQCCWWRLSSCGMLCHVSWLVVTDISEALLHLW